MSYAKGTYTAIDRDGVIVARVKWQSYEDIICIVLARPASMYIASHQPEHIASELLRNLHGTCAIEFVPAREGE